MPVGAVRGGEGLRVSVEGGSNWNLISSIVHSHCHAGDKCDAARVAVVVWQRLTLEVDYCRRNRVEI